MRNSILQLFRTKVRTLLFFILIILCALLVCLGSNLIIQCKQNMEHFKEVFVTIGTVEQKPIMVTRMPFYDAETKGYTYQNSNEYDKMFSLSNLDMDGVSYISGPERRPFYQVYLPDYKIIDDDAGWSNQIIVEASPIEDCVPNGPVKMNIKKVNFCVYQLNVDEFYYCDHYTENPDKMYADKTYIMCLAQAPPHGFRMGNPDGNPHEYRPYPGPYTKQARKDGTLIPSKLSGNGVEEMNDEFYQKGHDKYWTAYTNELEMLFHTVPVTPTDDLNLIMAFYNGDACIRAGRVLEGTDFEQGSAVCLISSKFARRNNINVGDKIPLSFRVANYSYPAVIGWGNCPLTSEGKNFKPFFETDYSVAGIYDLLPGGGNDQAYSLADNEIIIPENSIKTDNTDNIGDFGNRIRPYNTSFRIPNGTIDDFMEEWEAKGINDVTIHFYDKGYSQLEDGIIQMERMAYFLLGAGILMTSLVIVFFSHMMIGGQKKRTAIERSLGSGKWQCLVSLLTGIILVAAVGCIIGCMSGALLTGRVALKMKGKEIFDQRYSAGVVYSEANDIEQPVVKGDVFITVVAFFGLFGFTLLVSGISAWRNLREEPLALLSGNEQG